jgi:DNA-binding PadR family transcriptional regulator
MPAGPKLTPLDVATLALLVEGGMHPYEMHRVLVQRGTEKVVKMRASSVYNSVHRLLREDLIRVVDVDRDGNRPERTTYEINELGHQALSASIETMIAGPVNEFPVLPLALSQAHHVPKDTVLRLLRDRVDRLEQEMAELRVGIDRVTAKQLPARYWIEWTYQLATYETESRWIATVIDGITSGDIAW